MARGNGRKRIHDPPHSAEQADKWGSGPNGREKPELTLNAFGFPLDGDIHRLVDAVLHAWQQRLAWRASFERAPPFTQGGGEHGGERMIGAL